MRLTPEQVAAGEPALRYQWNAPIVLSPHNPGIVFIANQYVWRSLSRGAPGTFQKISPDLTKASKEKIALSRKTNLQWATIYTFAESPKKPGLYWAGTDDGNVQVSTDGGGTWTNITNQFYDAAGKPKPGVKGDLIPYDRWVKRVVPSAFDENTCYVAFSGYRTHNEDRTWLFVTKDLGKTWTDISGGMNNPIFDVEEDPDNANVLYLGTDNGIWVTVDQGKTWTAFTTSQPTMVIRDLAIQKRDREMAIGTYARGFFVADIAPMKEFKPEVFEKAAHLFEPQAAIKWNRFERRGETLGEMVRADQSAGRRDDLLLPEGRRAEGDGHHQGPRGHDGQRVHADGEEGAAEGVLEPEPPGAAGSGTGGRRPRRAWRRGAGRGRSAGRGGTEPGSAAAGCPGGRRRARRARRRPGRPRRLQGDADGGRERGRDEAPDRQPRPAVQIARSVSGVDCLTPPGLLAQPRGRARLDRNAMSNAPGTGFVSLLRAAARPVGAAGAEGPGTITGRITDPSGLAVANAVVTAVRRGRARATPRPARPRRDGAVRSATAPTC